MSRSHYLTDSLTMTDRERILTVVAMFGAGPFQRVWENEEDLTGWALRDARPGDLVKASTQRWPSRWVVSWYVGPHPGGYAHILRELGGEGLCHMGNESLYSLRGVPPHLLLEGHQYRAYVKVRKAFGISEKLRSVYSGGPRFHGFVFPDRHSKEGVIQARCHSWRLPNMNTKVRAVPIPFTFDSRTRIRNIVDAITAATPDGIWESRFEPMAEGERTWAVDP